MKRISLATLCLVLFASFASADDYPSSAYASSIEPYAFSPKRPTYPAPTRWLAALSWDMGLGIGSFNDFISNVSFAGLQIEGRWFLSRSFSLGFTFGWNRFSQSQGRETVQTENGALTATAYHYADFMTPKATAHYYVPIDSMFRPYVGLGIGPTSVTSDVYVADLAFRTANWHLMIAPEAGVLIPLRVEGGLGGLQIGARYNITTADFASVNAAQYLSWQIGFFSAM